MGPAATPLEIITGDGRALLVALVLVLGAAYLIACWRWPFTGHGRCSGTGKLRSPGGRAWRKCPTCRGTGTKLRVGRRLWGAMTSSRRER